MNLQLTALIPLKLSETFSMAVAGRYIRSNLKVTDTEMHLQLIHLQ
jgi:hypothetical protein